MTSEGKSIDVTRPQRRKGRRERSLEGREREAGRKLDFLHRPNRDRNGSGGTDGITGEIHVQVARVGSLPIDIKRPLLSIHSIGLLSSNMDFLQPEHVTHNFHKANSLADVTNH